VIAIGDSIGDIDMFQMVGFSIAFNSSCPALDQIASVCVQSQNLADIIPKLPLQKVRWGDWEMGRYGDKKIG
jgi:hydroxymethylpyrimidine pyrophosphatase-like HAD family hydrolase